MADDGKARDDASAPPDEESAGPMPSLQGATAPPREKPLIEAEPIAAESAPGAVIPPPSEAALKEGSEDATQEVSAAAPEPKAEEAAAAEEAAQAEVSAAAMEAPALRPLAPGQPTRRANLWPVAAALVIGALIAVFGAFFLHLLDKTPQALAALDARVARLEHRQEASVQAVQAGEAALDQRVSALESFAQTTAATLANLQQTVQQVAAAQKQQAQSAAAAGPAPSAAPMDLAPLTARVSKLEDGLAALDRRMGDLTSQFAAEKRETQAAKDQAMQFATAHAEANAVAILAASLRRNVESGAPFADDLAALANQGFDKSKLAALEPVAATGIATPAALIKQFSAIAPDLIATVPEPKAKGFFGRLAQDAAHLVRFRKIGDLSGTDPAAQVARIEAALNAGAIDEALREWNDLPAAAKAKSQAFAEAARQRLAAVSAAKTIEADALAALAKVKS